MSNELTPQEQDDNRREHARIMEPPVEVSGDWISVVDVSEGGICLRTNAPMRKGDRCELILTDGAVFYTQSLDAEVMWRAGDKIGLRWIDPNEDQQEWLRERCAIWKEETLSAQVRPQDTILHRIPFRR